MHVNSDGLAHFAEAVGDHEGRLTHKSPPRTLYDTAYKERWFKLKANMLFYYRLNEFGGVEKNEPSGVFVLENIEVQMEDSDAPFGFAIRWKDDLERKHLFFAKSEISALTWVNKLIHASYEHMRAQLTTLRVQLRRKTGKDPLEHLGTPLMQRVSRVNAQRKSQFHVNLEEHRSLQELPKESALQSSRLTGHQSPDRRSPSRYSLPSKSPSVKVEVSKSPSLREPVRTAPVPPPRKGKKQDVGNGHVVVDNLIPELECKTVDDLVPGVGCNKASFKCHIDDECLPSKKDNLLD